MSDDDQRLTQVETNPVEEAVSEYDPVEHLSEKQIHAVMKMVMFPNVTNRSVAGSVGVTPRTISNWKQDEHFMAHLNQEKRNITDGAIQAASVRRAHVYDKLTEEMLPRFQEPERDPAMLETVLGVDYTDRDRQRYEERFVTNLPAKELLKIWGQFDDKMMEEQEKAHADMGEQRLVAQIRERHVELRVLQKDMQAFVRRTGFDFNVNYHDEDPDRAFRRKAEMDQAEIVDPEDEFVDAEFVDAEEDDKDLLSKHSLL